MLGWCRSNDQGYRCHLGRGYDHRPRFYCQRGNDQSSSGYKTRELCQLVTRGPIIIEIFTITVLSALNGKS